MGEIDVVAMSVDGRIVPPNGKKAKIPLVNSFHYGLGTIFEGMRANSNSNNPEKEGTHCNIFRLEDHVNRFFNSAKSIGWLKIPATKEQVKAAIINTVSEHISKKGYRDMYIRPFTYLQSKFMGMDQRETPVHWAVATWPWDNYHPDQISVMLSKKPKVNEEGRWRAKASYNYGQLLGSEHMAARKLGLDDVIFLDEKGRIAEASTANIFYVKGRKVYTPSDDAAILLGITRDSMIKLLKYYHRINIIKRDAPMEEIYGAKEAWVSGSAVRASRICKVVDREGKMHLIGNPDRDEIYPLVKSTLIQVQRGETLKFRHWLTPVY